MKNMFFLLVLLATSSLAQDIPTSVKKGRILTSQGEKITFSEFQFGEQTHRYKVTASATLKDIASADIYSIEQQTGSEAGKWALWIGLSGLTGSLLGVAQANNESKSLGYESDSGSSVGIVVGLTALSAGIGAAIGSTKKKYKTVYTNPQYGTNAPQKTIRVGLCGSSRAGYGASFSIQF